MKHEWIKIKDTIATVGISQYGIKEFGDIVNIEFSKKKGFVKKKEEICVLETMKSAIEISSPLEGEIVQVNENIDLKDLNEDPEEKGWLFKIKVK